MNAKQLKRYLKLRQNTTIPIQLSYCGRAIGRFEGVMRPKSHGWWILEWDNGSIEFHHEHIQNDPSNLEPTLNLQYQ